ncbi:TIGR01777 family protein [Pseudomonas sp. C27(2019)]|uniref:TIGR01777 family oxidoreductase n=1 Tax=Pseudomonas sp. C27(2019) TaxID=2604941 RepID=UPI001245CC0A|nr:TIGR01777 family oxidoreductase [Pseudomonas sp. C27(2019)]QEY60032.1 TIGR01777 family protein [Pseudomonas sp. C27(2019)]
MRILITGGTGLIGRSLCQFWLAQGHELYVWSRTPERVKGLCGDAVHAVAELRELDQVPLDAVINLAGAPIADRPWTQARRKLLRDSRIALTNHLVSWLASLPKKPAVLISGSAVGWYGDGGEGVLTESSPVQSSDFATQLCADWETAAQAAEPLGMRVVLIRTGLVLTGKGGFLSRLMPLFKLGLGGKQGSGQQWMPWVHLDDEVALIDHVLHHAEARGPYNACAPEPVRNQDFAKALGQHVKRPAFMAAPGFVLKLMLGEMAGLLLGGQNIRPERTQDIGFEFKYKDLKSALANL